MTDKVLHEVQDILCLPSLKLAAKLLGQYKWNKEKLLSDFFSGVTQIDDSDHDDSNEDEGVGKEWNSSASSVIECPVCMEKTPMSATHALSCGHRYCEDCWVGYLTV